MRPTALPPPGSEEQLKNLASRVFAQQLDRTKPLWEIWLVEGLAPAEDGSPRFALLSKTHHALVDGVAGVDITAVLFDTAARARDTARARAGWVPRPEPTSMQLLGDALIERAVRRRDRALRARRVPRAARQVVAAACEALAGVGAMARAGLGAPPTPLNVDDRPAPPLRLGATRPEEIKEIKNALGGTVNDVVAGGRRRALCAGSCSSAASDVEGARR